MGRPSKRTPDVVQRILDGLSIGTPLTIICAADDMPHDNRVRDWMASDPELSIAIARAREAGFDRIALDAMEIADAASRDTIKTDCGDRADNEWIARSKLRVETRLKLLAKWDPKRYGDAMLHKHADADGEKIKPDEVSALTRLASLADALSKRIGHDPDDAS